MHLGGDSMIINPWGTVLAQGDDTEQIVTAEADFSIVADIRDRINVFKDRRPKIYTI
jgi:predicted amidohydrolase